MTMGKENDTVIQGWVCRDKKDNALNLHAEKPYRAQSGKDLCRTYQSNERRSV